MIIDFHTHPFLESGDSICIYDKSVEWTGIKPLFDELGVSVICGSVLKKQRETDSVLNTIKRSNADALNLRDKLDGFYVPGIHIHPDYVLESVDEIKKYNDMGVKLIGELVPYMHGWGEKIASKGMYEIMEEAATRDMVVNIHTMNEEDIDKLVSDNPRVTFVLAHPGENPQVLRHIERMKKNDNVYLDLAGTGVMRYGVIKYLINQVGAERILFGTDYPVSDPAMYKACVEFEKLSDKDKEYIYYKNAQRLLGL